MSTDAKVTDYTIVSDASELGLINRVRAAMRDGWTPIGGISVTRDPEDSLYGVIRSQALVHYAK
jgi:hypothetical protein